MGFKVLRQAEPTRKVKVAENQILGTPDREVRAVRGTLTRREVSRVRYPGGQETRRSE